MLGFPLAFTIPAVLGALVLLPVLYYLLRVTPPRPRSIPFPPLRLILDQAVREETPARMPLWLLMLRLAIAAAVILAMAGPIWNPPAALTGGASPVLVILDDGFAAAPSWDRRVAAAAERLKSAERQGRPTGIVALSEGARAVQLGTATEAVERLRALKPRPIEPDRLLALPALQSVLSGAPETSVIWIADGLENGHARAFADALAHMAKPSNVAVVSASDTPAGIAGVINAAQALDIRVVRAAGGMPQAGRVRALDLKGLPIGEAPFTFAGDAGEGSARLELPVELRNEIAQVAIEGVASAGAVNLIDARWQRRRVGLVSGTTADTAQPLLSPTFYLARALAPFADVRQMSGGNADPIVSLLDEQPSVMILADLNLGQGAAHDRLADFVAEGGILIRFAGARLAGAADDLVPVSLRKGGRSFGGALSWDQPKPLAPFERGSPFFGLQPHDTVTVSRQVLAEPDPGLADKTWAALSDGTPLVTAEKRGKGTLVLFHVTADTAWSNLPLSGLFVDMLRKVVALSSGVAGPKQAASADILEASAASLAPSRTLDGFGVLRPPPPTAKPLIVTGEEPGADIDHPPGLYGPTGSPVALNALGPKDTLTRASFAGLGFSDQALAASEPVDLRVPLVVAALAAFLLDSVATVWLAGGLRRRGRMLAASVLLACIAGEAWSPSPARADDPGLAVSKQEMQSALGVRLAYVATGDASVDDVSRQGLAALSRAIAERTSLAPGDVIGVDPARDDLAFYPLLYWPIVASQPKPPPAAIARVAAFMKHGGTILFDTRDALTSRPGAAPTSEAAWLRDLLAGIDVPDIEPLPADHVVTRTFYILAGFVGRYATGQTWIEALPPATGDEATRPARAGDSVSPIIITGNDLAGAWAQDNSGQPLFPLVPGGARQRELAIRGGINLVMYTLTGNYKADQVHVRDLLERLSR